MQELAYYDNGADKFRDGEPIYLNRAVEQQVRHVHAHNYIEIAYVASGRGIHIFDGRQYEVSRGDLFVINYDVSHEFRSLPGEANLVVYNCIFRPEFIDRSLIHSRCFSDIGHIFLFHSLFRDGTAGNDIRVVGGDDPEIGEIYEKMFREYHVRGYGYLELLRACLVEMLVRIFRLCRQREPAVSAARDRAMFDDAIRFMKEHYRQEIKVEELAAMTFLSRNYFCTCFKECTGVTVLEYIQGLRIEQACRLLRGSDRKVIDIALDVGYSDIKFFNRLFKKITGKTPSEYRQGV